MKELITEPKEFMDYFLSLKIENEVYGQFKPTLAIKSFVEFMIERGINKRHFELINRLFNDEIKI